MSVLWVQTIVMSMQHVPIHHDLLLVRVILVIVGHEQAERVLQFVEMVSCSRTNENNAMTAIQQMVMDVMQIVLSKLHLVVFLSLQLRALLLFW